MKNRNKEAKEWGIAIIFVVLIIIAAYALSWIVTCGIIKLITLCFGWTFKWSIATGIWLIMCLVGKVFKVTVKTK